ncbi:hypothetical protein HRG_008061 [Hirsutella rhossiliensis]|uniref:Uncharacterized protein n=1 Tax=Hirsutella rhossiliensis TaxID=111463 RepID=A0A9P8MS29_9HYPO|nr:uncharacterized protein HRG_08061 [Hirsutella rhossiliensis]KAH0960908.1 hypothetical protein HRG_08061 [Hirsutella rhossiliensis]
MATANGRQLCRPPTPETSPTLTPGACPDLTRCLSIGSSASSHSHLTFRGSQSGDVSSRHSSASYHSQASDTSNLSGTSGHGPERKGRRRGYVRPQPTDFAASARSRESVMSLGSIAHLQYYFARTGLLDGKGAQLARKKQTQRATLDLSALQGTSPASKRVSDADSSYASMGSSPDLGADALETASPLEMEDDDYYDDSFAESDSGMLPPTVSTYHHKDPQVPKPPTMAELKADLDTTLQDAAKALGEVRQRKAGLYEDPADAPQYPNMPEEKSQGWYELQGMHILDVVTLAIRAAKIYYTAHELPERLDSIKSEKQVRADLLGVMEVLKQMATRNFKGGLRDEEIKTMTDWIGGVLDMLTKEEDLEAAERAERANWAWLRGDWSGREYERERSFLTSMDPEGGPLPPWTPLPEASGTPTPFLESMQNGLRLVRLHNAVVNKSRRRFGAIPSFHVDTQKPYRCADNLRYWVKAAELRFEVLLKVDALGVVYNSGPQAWADFEAAILKWCRHVREEIASELDI